MRLYRPLWLVLLLVSTTANYSLAQDTGEAQGWHLAVLLEASRQAHPLKRVGRFPVEIRAVPIHPDDFNVNHFNAPLPIPPIPDTELTTGNYATFGLGSAIQYRKGSSLLGVGILFAPAGGEPVMLGSFNYANPGFGLAFTHYKLHFESDWWPQALFGYEHGNTHRLLTGYRLSQYRLNVETGWSRYGKDETYEIFDVGRNLQHEIQLGYGFVFCDEKFCGKFQLMGGPVFSSLSTRGFGNQMTFESATSWRLAFRLVMSSN